MNKKAFTLIELLIVMVIIGILAAAITVSYGRSIKRSRCSRVLQDMDAIGKAANAFREINDRWSDDVVRGAEPEFVPDYLKTWPTADYYKSGYLFDYERWPKEPAEPEIIAASLKPPETAVPNTMVEYYCIQDLRNSHTSCEKADDDSIADDLFPSFPAINRDGSCNL